MARSLRYGVYRDLGIATSRSHCSEKLRHHAVGNGLPGERSGNQFGIVGVSQLDQGRVSKAKSPSDSLSENFEWFGLAKGLDHLGIVRVNPLRLVAREQDEPWFEVQFPDPGEECLGIVAISKESFQFLRGDDDRFGWSPVERPGKVRGRRLLVIPQFLSAEFPGDRMVHPMIGPTSGTSGCRVDAVTRTASNIGYKPGNEHLGRARR
jgi:hypothetical protein